MGFGKWFMLSARMLVEGIVAAVEWAKPVEKDLEDREREIRAAAEKRRRELGRG